MCYVIEYFNHIELSNKFNAISRCTVRNTCQKASQSSPRWLSLGTGQQCIDFEQINPDRIPIDQISEVLYFKII